MASLDGKSDLRSYLKRQVLTLMLAPGSVIDEVRLAEAHGLSRTPTREVLRDLAGEGYLSLDKGRGARVSDLSHATLRDFFHVAPMIYEAVLRLAAVNRTDEQVEALQSAQDAFRASLRHGQVADRTLANIRFHEITGEMSGNVYILPSFHRLLIDHARIGMTFYRPSTPDMSEKLVAASAQHDAIIDAIARGDAEDAARLAQAHWQLSKSEIESYVMPEGLSASLGPISNARSA